MPACGADQRDCFDREHKSVCERIAGSDLSLQLRRSYRCDCVEKWDRRPGRLTLPVLESDPAESVYETIERDTGVRVEGCPWRALRDPFVARVVRAHRAFTKGDLSARLGPHTSAALVSGVECFDAALNAIEVADMKADRAKREREAADIAKPKAKRRK